MIRRVILGAVACALLAGCQNERFSSVRLGEVGYQAAYREAVGVFGDYYSIAKSDAGSGKIISRPKATAGRPDLILTNPRSRELAEMRIRRDKGQVWADLRVQVQRQQSGGYASMDILSTQHERPDKTPGQTGAPYTADQNDLWKTTGVNRLLERRILNDLYRRMHPEPLEPIADPPPQE